MSAININQTLIDTYLALLRNLNQNDKLELISKLSQSMQDSKKDDTGISPFFGSFISDKTAEELIEEVKQSRIFNRTNEAF